LSYSFKKLLLFEIPYSIFDIQNAKHAKAIRLKGEGFKPGEWKNKIATKMIFLYVSYPPPSHLKGRVWGYLKYKYN